MIKAINVHRPDRISRLRGLEYRTVRSLVADRNLKTPLLILSRSEIRSGLDRLSKALPGVNVHYAVKSNNHEAILKEVVAAGHGFDVASSDELNQIIRAGGQPDQAIHSHPIKAPSEIRAAFDMGARIFVVDNPDEIEKFRPYTGKVKLLVRFKVEDSQAVVNLSYKFGCEPNDVPALVEKISRLKLDFYGVTFHVGSQCVKNDIYIKAVEAAGDIISRLTQSGYVIRLLDIGGGFPVPYTSRVLSIGEFCRPINRALRKRIPPEIRLACEPGRFVSAPAVTLVSSVIGKSKRSGRNWYFLDDGLYGSFSGRLYDHGEYRVLTNRNTTWKRSVLAGPTCDSFDVIYKDIILPPLNLGDLLMFPAMGAYCSVSATNFNSLRKAEYIVID
nr:type III PLP-dependent enzyme [candidate division Zixibacteria bacterium]